MGLRLLTGEPLLTNGYPDPSRLVPTLETELETLRHNYDWLLSVNAMKPATRTRLAAERVQAELDLIRS